MPWNHHHPQDCFDESRRSVMTLASGDSVYPNHTTRSFSSSEDGFFGGIREEEFSSSSEESSRFGQDAAQATTTTTNPPPPPPAGAAPLHESHEGDRTHDPPPHSHHNNDGEEGDHNDNHEKEVEKACESSRDYLVPMSPMWREASGRSSSSFQRTRSRSTIHLPARQTAAAPVKQQSLPLLRRRPRGSPAPRIRNLVVIISLRQLLAPVSTKWSMWEGS